MMMMMMMMMMIIIIIIIIIILTEVDCVPVCPTVVGTSSWVWKHQLALLAMDLVSYLCRLSWIYSSCQRDWHYLTAGR